MLTEGGSNLIFSSCRPGAWRVVVADTGKEARVTPNFFAKCVLQIPRGAYSAAFTPDGEIIDAD